MSAQKSLFIGPRLRRLRRDLGLRQADMAEDLGVSPSYVALIERNQRPLTAELLLRLAETYRLDLADFAGDGGEALADRLEHIFRDPLLGGLDVTPTDRNELALGAPDMAEALVRLYGAWQEAQVALADCGDRTGTGSDPLTEVREFLTARQNYFPALDEAAERLSAKAEGEGSWQLYLEKVHGTAVRRLPTDVMNGAVRRYDPHRHELSLDETLDGAGHTFQVALQLAYLALGDAIAAALDEQSWKAPDAARLARRALANYAAGAMIMPYTSFYRAAERRGYDMEALSRQFGVSFEQAAHRLTTLQKPGSRGPGFFFIRVDAAGNVSKRFDGGGFPFARHGGSCPLWSLHDTFRRPREVVTELLELPDGQRFFSLARTVRQGGGAFGVREIVRSVAVGCRAEEAHRLIYTRNRDLAAEEATPIGITCRLCQRADCTARAEPPLGRTLLPDDYRRPAAPFGFQDG